jgi:mannose/fructose/N-acetylgalactosamine-specific phosphotransferase system component IIC
MPAFDGHMVVSILGVALLCGIIGLDRTAAGQFMISQPIVAGPLTGWLLGDVTAGAVIGATLELIWVLDLPVGTFVPADSTVCAVASTAISALSCPGCADMPRIGFGVFLTVIMVPVTMKADRMVRTANSRLVDSAAAASGADVSDMLSRAQARGLFNFFMKSAALCCVFIPLGIAAESWFRHQPAFVQGAMQSFLKLIPLLGAAAVIRKLTMETLDRMVIAGFAVSLCLVLITNLPATAVLALAAAAGLIGTVYRERRAKRN